MSKVALFPFRYVVSFIKLCDSHSLFVFFLQGQASRRRVRNVRARVDRGDRAEVHLLHPRVCGVPGGRRRHGEVDREVREGEGQEVQGEEEEGTEKAEGPRRNDCETIVIV